MWFILFLSEELQNYVKTSTAPYKYPRKIEFVESLPKTVSGKIRRTELRMKELKDWKLIGLNRPVPIIFALVLEIILYKYYYLVLS